jgi:predicted nucleic acid-binding protein
MILVDTSVWVDFFRGVNSPQRRALHRLIENKEDISITGIILAEILQGIRDERNFVAIKSHLLEFPIFTPAGIETHVAAARLYRDCRKKGRTVRKTADCIIAAICLENDLALLHKDADFDSLEACARLRCHRSSG